MLRGYSVVGLDNPKINGNVGSVLRCAGNYGVPLVMVSGHRYRKVCTDTLKYHKHNPLIEVEDLMENIPYDCVPVAVDIIDGAKDLRDFVHPERAFYIFGAEDNTLGKKITDRCRDIVYIPTIQCLNLSGAVHTVLYDRFLKQRNKKSGVAFI